MTERRFSVKQVTISRGYSKNTPFVAEVNVENLFGSEIKVKLPEDRVFALIELVDDLVVAALTEQFTNMREDHIAAIEEQKLKALEDGTIDTPVV